MCIGTADCTAVRIGIDFLRLSNRLNLVCIVAYILFATNAKLCSVLFRVNLVMKTGI